MGWMLRNACSREQQSYMQGYVIGEGMTRSFCLHNLGSCFSFSPSSLLARMSSLQYTAIDDIPKTIKELRYQFDNGKYKITFIA